MATGEKNGQWGTITNTNLSSILEQAVAGTVNISITGASSPITLTENNGAADQSRSAILLITGTNASPISIIAPASSKLYYVNNASNQTITIKASASTGVALAAGVKQFVFYDTNTSDFALGPKANVTGTVTSVQVAGGTTGLTFSGGPITTAGTITLGGTLAIANGGTGATTQDGGLNNLLPSQAGQAGKFLTTNGANTSWATVAAGGGTVTSVAVSTTLSGITITGSPITSSGTIALGGTLGIANGGTGQTTANAAFNALVPSQVSNSGRFLTTDGTNTSWGAAVTSVTVSGGTTGLSFTGGPITTSGTITMGGALGVTNGGTGASNASTAINNLLPNQAGNAGKVLGTDGSAVSWVNQSGGGGGGLTSVGVSGGSTGFTFSNSPLTANGVMTMSGVANILNGGTGATTSAGARANLQAAQSGSNSDITSLNGLSTPLSIAQGGTAANNVTSAINNLLPSQSGNSGRVLITNGSSVSWFPVVTSVSMGSTGLTPNTETAGVVTVGGTLNASSGGTGNSSYSSGDILYASGGSSLSRRSIGSSGQVLTVSGGVPVWQTPASGGGIVIGTRTVLSGSSAAYSSLPSNTRRIIVMLDSVSVSTSTTIYVGISNSGALVSGTYIGNTATSGSTTRWSDTSAGVAISGNSGGDFWAGTIYFSCAAPAGSGNLWTVDGDLGKTNDTGFRSFGGAVDLDDSPVFQVSVYVTSGVFDFGSVTFAYQTA